MAYTLWKSVPFGPGRVGLSTVGYTLCPGGIPGTRVTAGVVEVGTATGVYGASVSVAQGFAGSILWDTGQGASTVYADDEINPLTDVATGIGTPLPIAADIVAVNGTTFAGPNVPTAGGAGGGDPLATAVPGDYADGTAGQIIGGLGYLSGGTLLAGPIDSNLKSVNGTTFTGPNVPTASNVKKGQALNAFGFVMTDATTHLPAPGLTVAATRSLDGAAFAACANAPSGVASGAYKVNLAAGDLNANVVILRFTAAGADDLLLTVVTQP